MANCSEADLANVQISGIENNAKLQKFNFVLTNGWRSSLQSRVRMTEKLIQPPGAIIKKIHKFYGTIYEHDFGLIGLMFFDKGGI